MVNASGEALRVGARLGWLYLDQGHPVDAEKVFAAVLESDPEDASAREGLETARRRRAASTSTGAPSAGLPAGPGSGLETPDSLRQRRLAVLAAWLERIRRRAAAPV
jgi:hypothetical protein